MGVHSFWTSRKTLPLAFAAWPLRAMGCTSSTCGSLEPCNGTCHVPHSFPQPSKEALPPDGNTHRRYMKQLNAYLNQLEDNPGVFQRKVETRRDAHFGEHRIKAMPEPRMPPGSVAESSEADWLPVGL